MFSAGGEGYSKTWQAGKFGKLPDDVKLLMAVGQVNRPSYDCFKTKEARGNWVLTMINKGKGEEELLGQDALAELVGASVGKGYVSVNGNGPQLTKSGLEYVRTFKVRTRA